MATGIITAAKKIIRKVNLGCLLRYASSPIARAHVALPSSFDRPYKLNIGCGHVRFPGWVNIDSDPAISEPDLLCNVTTGIPFPDKSCCFIYSEHFLEHLTVEQGLVFLAECRRVLQPTGVMRIAMPSLDVLIDKSYRGNWREQDWLTWPSFKFIQSRAEMLNISFRSWGHQWLYDREELHRRLKEVGFASILDVSWGASQHYELANRETRKDSLLICEVSG